MADFNTAFLLASFLLSHPALGTVNFIFSPVTSQKTFLTGLGTCITNNVANNAALDAASQARYAVCATTLSVVRRGLKNRELRSVLQRQELHLRRQQPSHGSHGSRNQLNHGSRNRFNRRDHYEIFRHWMKSPLRSCISTLYRMFPSRHKIGFTIPPTDFGPVSDLSLTCLRPVPDLSQTCPRPVSHLSQTCPTPVL
ncbi:unnamed protein product [Darwinula stevensoni]|uniref:Uncharacterized protein n=1 Tax=Darwinula stevensoni TaxID=69355 RepID=A0A7R9A9J8_9CRUS|nr:unnamed protein product [Darwinula stevensoni]CAG0897411.1 unnamed protein product [Darwinula stevensoni]